MGERRSGGQEGCPFCRPHVLLLVEQGPLVLVARDGFPVSPGHSLVILRRHVPRLFDTTLEERQALFAALARTQAALQAELDPQGFNIGINEGAAGGQTVSHLHVHVIPRFTGDVDDPRGGVRHVIPGKGNYLSRRPDPLATGGHADPFLRHLQPLFRAAERIRIVAAFVQDSGLSLLAPHVEAALERGTTLRVVTGDYLHITQARALRRLLDWATFARAVAGAEDEEAADLPDRELDGERSFAGQRALFEARVVEVAPGNGLGTTFHPKSWIFENAGGASAFVGSSNVSRAALRSGVEWNLRVDRARDPDGYARVCAAFEELWVQARVLDTAWVDAYEDRCRFEESALPPGEDETEPPAPSPDPHDLQVEALDRLAEARRDGRARALVVMATGLGKTLLAAFDFEAFAGDRPDRPRLLFLAHRAEILRQAAEAFRRVSPSYRFGWMLGAVTEPEGDIVFASVQKLSRGDHLRAIAPNAFDYVVVDEVHHAAAASYRRVLGHLQPGFLLGLTATPDRADEADVLGIFDDNLAYRADLGVGIERGFLVPFEYAGLRDTTDYAPIPWRNRRFDPEVLARAVQTEARMEQLWRAWRRWQGKRTLVFCCSIAHARFARDWLARRGVRAVAVHSAPDSASRVEAVESLTAGALDAICAVDLFNEGVDLPLLDRVVMLRPTESMVVFLQQLGRGLRVAEGKRALQVIDFVGNHRIFLDRVRTLLSLGGHAEQPLREALKTLASGASLDLPGGCSVAVELEAVELLRRLLPSGGASAIVRAYRELREARGERPRAGELFRLGYSVRSLRPTHGSWLELVDGEGDLVDEAERAAYAAGRRWFADLEVTRMDKCFKMVVLEAMLEAGALRSGLPLRELARRCYAVIVRSPELIADIDGVKRLGDDPRAVTASTWFAYWKKNPIQHWTGEGASKGRRRWFAVVGDRFESRLPWPESGAAQAAFSRLTAELVDYRLAQYRARRLRPRAGESAFEAKVFWNGRDPILKLPPRKERPGLPTGETDVRLPDGRIWQFRFVKIACNVARPVGSERNELPDLLRSWFGPAAGQPGTRFHVGFRRSPDGWWAEPVQAVARDMPRDVGGRAMIVAFPSLRAAAGAPVGSLVGAPEANPVLLPVSRAAENVFAVRASGSSMDGGANPICDGDWVVLRYARREPFRAIEGRVVLVAVGDVDEGQAYLLKRVARQGRGFVLLSDNPAVPPRPVDDGVVVIARMVTSVSPETLAPAQGATVPDDGLPAAFSLPERPQAPWARVAGHLFVLLEGRGALLEPDLAPLRVERRQPGETAFVLTRPDAGAPWRYAGVGRWDEAKAAWRIPEVDHSTWKALGVGRHTSRRLDEPWRDRAARWTASLLRSPGRGGWIEHAERRCRIVGPAARGGLRIDGGRDGFRERTVSHTDLGWALAAREHSQREGAPLDEPLVNRLRYLAGTPRASTHWIDTRWALVLVLGSEQPGAQEAPEEDG